MSDFQGQVLIFLFSSAVILGRLWVNGTAIFIMSAVVCCLSEYTISGPLKFILLSVMRDLTQCKITLAVSSSGSVLYLKYGAVTYTI